MARTPDASASTDSEPAASWQRALDGDADALEGRLAADSRLPGPRANLELAHRVADLAHTTPAERRADALRVLRRWLSDDPGAGPDLSEAHREYLAAVAALCTGAILAAGPDPDATALLDAATADPRWRVRELAATGLQRVLAADWDRGLAAARAWLPVGPLPARAAVAAVAEPPLLRDPRHAVDAASVVARAVDVLLAVPASARRDPDVRVLRKALGYAVSVVAAADPDAGIPLLERLAASTDGDARWIARENLTKARLAPLSDRLTVARDALSRP
ncbi:hypothetical protein [Leifsonia sp. 1010]|uniref:hypothetical protein n=1 Tax=Leifsonia sp. 1010 TaxID=2817769 RepID=UPI00285F2A91|nr:hypothetical protein [Leifsonia sp. 1010]MDR6612215.1 hypothetical protein [Leifsonia sp. 1010]